MEKQISIFLAALLLLTTGCSLVHTHSWIEATCELPRTCRICGETEGESLGHDWQEATCETPQTCIRCGATKGDALGHEWMEATCDLPKTCSKCGKTEGSALGHNWLEATCVDPKTCTRCGWTEGDPLGHTPTEADYWNPSVCSVCGIEIAPIVVPELLKGLKGTFMEVGENYNYKTQGYYNNNVQMNEMIRVVEYYSIPGGALTLEELEGYEWKIAVIQGINKHPQVFNLGAMHYWWKEDVYGAWEDQSKITPLGKNNAGNDMYQFSVEWNGKTYDQCIWTDDAWTEDNRATKTRTIYHEFFVRVPIGYDGIFIGLLNYANRPDTGDFYIHDVADDDSLYFRMQ